MTFDVKRTLRHMSTQIVSELATPAEAAAELRVSVGVVKRWLREGEIGGVRTPGGHWRIPLSEIRGLRTHRVSASHHHRSDMRAAP